MASGTTQIETGIKPYGIAATLYFQWCAGDSSHHSHAPNVHSIFDDTCLVDWDQAYQEYLRQTNWHMPDPPLSLPRTTCWNIFTSSLLLKNQEIINLQIWYKMISTEDWAQRKYHIRLLTLRNHMISQTISIQALIKLIFPIFYMFDWIDPSKDSCFSSLERVIPVIMAVSSEFFLPGAHRSWLILDKSLLHVSPSYLFLFYFYLLKRQRDRDRRKSSIHWFTPPDTCQSQSCASLETGAFTSIWVSHMMSRIWVPELTPAASQGAHQ